MHLVSLGHGGPHPEKCSNEPWPVEHVKNTLQNMTPPIVMTCGSNFSSGSCNHSCPLLHQGNHPDGALEVQLAGAAHLGVAGVLVADVIDAHHVVEEMHQLWLSHAHADDISWRGLGRKILA